ncbi:MAG TPA: ankyrin repeat domain-containing protein [Blastocatellia bacterium]|nr:ankyrin repeat domain-containing protein [Blastocatellia bacterium]
MKKLLLLSLPAVILIFGFQRDADTQTKSQITSESDAISHTALDFDQPERNPGLVEESEIRKACDKSIRLIQHSQVVWSKKETCTSCHHQLLPELPLRLARERGVPFDQKVARDATAAAFAYLKDLDAAVQGYDYIDVLFDAWSLVAAHAAGVKPSLSTAAYAQFIAGHQHPDGSWPTTDNRPPQAHSLFTTTAVCAKAVRDYLPESLKAERETRMRRAREWLLKARPQTTEDRAFQLLGLHWTGAGKYARDTAMVQLLAEQRNDGGWSQLPGLASDAYATGEVLSALREGNQLSTTDAIYERGARFLLKAQEPDGSWRVRSRLHPPAPVSPPYFDTEFPYQHDQFISAMGTSWATSALLHKIPVKGGGTKPTPASPDIAPAEQERWIQVALSGSAAHLKRLLDAGMKPDARTSEGTTALMFAARDIEKVKLLVKRGADVNARAGTGITPLMVAARHRGNTEVVRLLLKKGARPNAEKGVEVRNDASALFFAIMAEDTKIVEALLDAGARLEDRMKLIGRIPVTPLFLATVSGEPAMVDCLIGRGANANEVDGDGISVLAWASIANHVDTVQALLARGAQVNNIDKFGMTPLLYAASIDYGDTRVLEKLIAAGADLWAKNKEGVTAAELAKKYNHLTMANLLAAKVSPR